LSLFTRLSLELTIRRREKFRVLNKTRQGKTRREQKMLMQPITDRQGNIFCELRSIMTRWGKQAICEVDAHKYEFLEMPYFKIGN
jgi:hypothetical protein